MGCGYAEYKDSRKYNKLYVCNYGPGYVLIVYIISVYITYIEFVFFRGNVVGYKPYAAGNPSCSSHGLSQSAYYQGLCTAPLSLGTSNYNTFETYEYLKNNDINNNNIPYTSQILQIQYSSLHLKQAPSITQTSIDSSQSQASAESSLQTQIQEAKTSISQFANQVPLRTYLTAYNTELKQKSVNSQRFSVFEDITTTTKKPVRRGWNLLTWRG